MTSEARCDGIANPIREYMEKTGLSFDQIAVLSITSIPQIYRLVGRQGSLGNWQEVRLRTIIRFFELSDGKIDLLSFATNGSYRITKNLKP